MKRKVTARQVLAIIAIALLVGMYLSALVTALIGSEFARTLLKISLLGTFIIPILIYVILMFYRIGHRNESPVPDAYADSKDDPYEQNGDSEDDPCEHSGDSEDDPREHSGDGEGGDHAKE